MGRDDDEEYEDLDWVIRPDDPWPDGVTPFGHLDHVAVAGISRNETAAAAFVASPRRIVVLEREPGNKYDPNAVSVFGMWEGRDGYATGGPLGYLPREVAAELAALEKDPRPEARGLFLHAKAAALYKPRPEEGKGPGVRLALGWSRTLDPLSVETHLTERPKASARRPQARATVATGAAPARRSPLLALLVIAVLLAIFVLMARGS
jgi:hypothetical protein